MEENVDIRFTVCGPLRAWRDGVELNLRPRQLRLMAALLLVRGGRTVAVEDFAALIWGDGRPATALNIVHRYIGKLRRMLEPDLPTREPGRWLRRSAGGYVLDVDATSSDLMAFRELARRGTEESAAGDLQAALALRMDALRLWQGRCADGLELSDPLVPEFVAIDQERMAVAREAADDALAVGDTTELLPLLRELAGHDQLDEALQARLLLVLTREGKQAEAVATFSAVRSRLADELGVDPGPELRAAFERAMRQELSPSADADRPAAPSARVPSHVPPSSRHFSGRSVELNRLDAAMAGVGRDGAVATTVVLDGLPGVGKTSLAVHWANQVAEQFPDGRLFLNLRGFDPADKPMDRGRALAHLLRSLGVPPGRIPVGVDDRIALYRTLMAERRMLVLLDNARDVEQVRPLIPASPGSLVLLTSRSSLVGLIAQEGAVPINVAVPTMAEARDSMRLRLGDQRTIGRERAIDAIIECCGRLPLAMSVVCARAAAHPGWDLEQIADELHQASFLNFFGDETSRGHVRGAFSWSYRMLSEPAARLFRLVSLHPGSEFGAASAASLAAASPRATRALLRELTSTSLISEYHRGRFAFHDLVRLYAMELSSEIDEQSTRDESIARALNHHVHAAFSANAVLVPASRPPKIPDRLPGVAVEPITDVLGAMAWFTTEIAVLEASVNFPESPHFSPWHVVEALMPFYQRRAMYERWEDAAQRALSAAIIDDNVEGRARMHRSVAGALTLGAANGATPDLADARGHLDTAIEHLQQALGLLDNPTDKALVFCNLGWVYSNRGLHSSALGHYAHALELFEASKDEHGMVLALFGVGYNRVQLRDYDAGIDALSWAEAMAMASGDENSAASCAGTVARALQTLGRWDEAIAISIRVRDLYRRVGNDHEYANNESSIGDLLDSVGRHDEAISAWRTARDRWADLGVLGAVEDLDRRIQAATCAR